MSIWKVIIGLLLILIHPVKSDLFFRYSFFNMFFVKNRFFCRINKGVYRDGNGWQCPPRPLNRGGAATPPPQSQSFHTFQILNSRVENIKIISLLFIQCKKIVYVDQRHHHRCANKNLFRMHIHPNRMGAIRDSAVKQLFLSLKVVKTIFLNLDLIYFIHCTAVL